MSIYLLMFAVSTACFFIGERTKRKYTRKIFILLGILLPALLAGLRSSEIGTDSQVYGISFFERALDSDSFIDYMQRQLARGHEDIGFNTIVYVSSLFSNDYHFGMFVYELVTVVMVYLGFCRYKKRYRTPVWLGMLLYFLCLYNVSLNIMRQCVATGFVFYAFSYVEEKDYKRYAFFMVIAFLMHSSSLVGLFPLFMYLFLHSKNSVSEKKQIIRGLLFVTVVFAITLGAEQMVELLVRLGIFRANYLNYLRGGDFSTVGEERSLSTITLAFQLIFLAAFVYHYRYLNRRKMDGLFFLMMSLIVMAISCIAPLFASYISRMSFFFVLFQMLGLANISMLYKNNQSRMFVIALLTVVVFATWYRTFVQLGYHETVPYQFFWQ